MVQNSMGIAANGVAGGVMAIARGICLRVYQRMRRRASAQPPACAGTGACRRGINGAHRARNIWRCGVAISAAAAAYRGWRKLACVAKTHQLSAGMAEANGGVMAACGVSLMKTVERKAKYRRISEIIKWQTASAVKYRQARGARRCMA